MGENNQIKSIDGYQRYDSRGTPTVQAVVKANSSIAQTLIPSGASAGSYEALELRDGGKDFKGKGVLKAVDNIKKISACLKGQDIFDQEKIDKIMINLDGTDAKSNLGANAILAVSQACAKVAAQSKNIPLYQHLAKLYNDSNPTILPMPMMNVMNGGAHVNWQGTDLQEFMIVPHGAESFTQAMKWACEIYQTLKNILKIEGKSTLVGDEGGFAPIFKNNKEPLFYIMKAITEAGYKAGKQVSIALDPAVSEIFDEENKIYKLRTEKRSLTNRELLNYWEELISEFPIMSIEDGFAEDDWDGWSMITEKLGETILVVGDDLIVTNPERIRKAISLKACNAAILKPNQIGTVSETLEAAKICKEASWSIVVAHRSGDTEDTFIADLSVGIGSQYIKPGAPARSDRNAKYNRLLDIEQIEIPQSGSKPKYAGKAAFLRN